MYYVSDSDPYWIVNTTNGADSSLRSEDYTAWEEEATQDYEPVTGIGMNLLEA